MMIDFIVHGSQDTVGVLVTDAESGQELTGWNMETDATVRAKAADNIPLGHKIALSPIHSDERVIKYGVPIGKAVQEIQVGQHVHTHNLKTARW